MLPIVVIAGRPNVGKSTLFNRLVGRRVALVSPVPGVTRDRKEADAMLGGRAVRLIDTAGLEEAAPEPGSHRRTASNKLDESLAGRMRASAEAALKRAALVLFVVDARAGITPADAQFATLLRHLGVAVLLVANKAEGAAGTAAALDAWRLGFDETIAVSAEHGEGIAELMRRIAEHLPPQEATAPPSVELQPLRIAIVGRPNTGKSTLLNRLAGEQRVITGPEPGLTRDAIAARIEDAKGPIELVDTAGLRRRARVGEPLEKLSVGAALAALRIAEVAVLVIEAVDGLRDQDLQIARLIEREGRAAVLALNKWDAVHDRRATRRAIAERLESSLAQMKGVEVVEVSALSGAGVGQLLPAARRAYEIWNRRVPTGELNRWLQVALAHNPPPMLAGRRLKLRYLTQAKARPPTFVLFGTRAEQLTEDYQRYLTNSLRESFGLRGTPIRLQLRGTTNPYTAPRERSG